ncbi:Calcium/calmodulin-dependent protein kinase type I [Linderina macrospora]|uniref:Calcium/calmodulin-dependent protein kinase type I n=1 Tax=Linderina macrospora TaxID=4868 RepID=A0ACC1J8Y4_9FUNG|nr:Calcium/calmodulin-dependent protein kinase type I [Linderina macrospora]
MTPFERDSPRAEVEAVVHCEYAFEPVAHWCHISPAAQHFIASLLVYDPDKRMTAKQALAHPWLQGSRKMVMPPVSPSLPRVFRSVFDNKVDSVHCRDVQMAASQGCDGDNGKTVAQPQVGNGINDSGYNAHHKHSPHANGQAPRPMMSGQTLADTANCSASTSASSSHRHQQKMLAEPTTPNLSTNSVVQFPRLDQSATVGVGQENPSGGFAMKDGTVGILANSNTTSFHLNNDSAMGSEVEDDDDEDNGRSSLGITLGVPAFKTKSVHGGEEIEMGSQNLIPGFSRNTHSNGRLNMNAMRLDLSKGSMAPVEERTSQMDVGWLMTPGASAYGDTSSARSSASDFSHE